jgi:hypothetical protein
MDTAITIAADLATPATASAYKTEIVTAVINGTINSIDTEAQDLLQDDAHRLGVDVVLLPRGTMTHGISLAATAFCASLQLFVDAARAVAVVSQSSDPERLESAKQQMQLCQTATESLAKLYKHLHYTKTVSRPIDMEAEADQDSSNSDE